MHAGAKAAARVADNSDGVVLDYKVVKANPSDAPMLVPAIKRIKARFGRAPKAVTADRGYGEAKVDAELEGLGVKVVATPARVAPAPPARSCSGGRGSPSWSSGAPVQRLASLV